MILAKTRGESGTPVEHPTWVVVQDAWNGWRTAMVMLDDLEDVHWFQPNGAPRPLIHAYVRCTKVQSGNLRHVCEGSAGPHLLLVCVLRSHSAQQVFDELARRASTSEGSVGLTADGLRAG